MPTYVYACTECNHGFEAQQAFTDDALTECPECGGKLRKVFNSVGIVFKGSGFYRNDSRGSNSSTTTSSDSKSTTTSSDSSSSSTSSDSKSSGSKSSDSKSSSSTPASTSASSGSSAA
ncbi:FmdB family zinc ribbon protein [Kineosporia succinea]|uniref:FmdB family regulatory protein n=1 Tax=Kineosporia succinea TaxID=84632 RepID=A0ABT9NZ93_9ACTN|nr:FmdB family zinc ribbon protein [Kineosporia succinea]MDP9825758.1 putative FmdB family regulatory protein [Kineosporia succinea]